jgi:hypothetical protein
MGSRLLRTMLARPSAMKDRVVMKKVLLVVVDALASRVVLPAIEAGRLPGMAMLIEHGVLKPECVSIFPSITPTATASIVTGTYPVDHDVAGAFWFNRDDDRIAYYGDDFWVILEEGIGDFFDEFLIKLNSKRLHSDTLYERIERHGLTAAAVNYMWFRGSTKHEVDAPWLFKLVPGIEIAPHVDGPSVLALGDFAASAVPGKTEKLQSKGGALKRFGFHDATTAEYLMELATAEPFPDFTLAYFPNNDYESHSNGPVEAVATLEEVDEHLRNFIEAMGGLEKFLDEFAIVIAGDHSQCDLLTDHGGRGIDLVKLLDGHKLAKPGQTWNDEDDLMACPNMRCCHFYLRDRTTSAREALLSQLLSDPRVDQVFWRGSDWDAHPAEIKDDCFIVRTEDRGTLEFRYSDESEADAHDDYGNAWKLEGSLMTVGAELTDGRLQYGDYPNALERIATGFTKVTGDLWATAKVGCEFELDETAIHRAGSHGSLHRDDSISPLIIAGLPSEVAVPERPRVIDLAPLCLQILGLQEDADQLVKKRQAGDPSLA